MGAVRLGCGMVPSSFAVDASGGDPVVVPAADRNKDSSQSLVLGVLVSADSLNQRSRARRPD